MPARRVLVPLVVVLLAALLYFWRGFGGAPIVDLSSDVNECCANLRQIYTGLVLYGLREKHAPTEAGVRFLGVLIASDVLEDTPTNRAFLTCPGADAEAVPEDVDYRNLAALTGVAPAYAARDTRAFPLAKFPSGGAELEPLVACDNARGLNHDGCMNVLYSDGSVVTLFLKEEIERGHLPAGATTIPVGRDSPIPELRKLTLDLP